jgi:G3E family GTPase
MSPIPTTILTGFLGAGKTTLLNRILREEHGLRIAVIENEFGEENIDNEILVQDSGEQIVEMNNGCICCTIRGDLVVALTNLAQKREAGEISFDRVVIETTGLANPGPVAQTFFVDEEVGAHYMLDAVVTVVDARHAMDQLDRHEEAQRQVGFADKILLSKLDLVDADALETLKMRLKRINPRAPISTSDFGRAPIAEVLDLRGFNLNDKLELDPDFLRAEEHDHDAPRARPRTHRGLPARPPPRAPQRRHRRFRVQERASVRSRAARPVPRQHGAGLRAEHAALQGRAVDGRRRAQGRLPGCASNHGQRPRRQMGA